MKDKYILTFNLYIADAFSSYLAGSMTVEVRGSDNIVSALKTSLGRAKEKFGESATATDIRVFKL